MKGGLLKHAVKQSSTAMLKHAVEWSSTATFWIKLLHHASIASQWRWSLLTFKFKLLNVILDQLMDCNVIIDHYRHIAVHKLDRNYI